MQLVAEKIPQFELPAPAFWAALAFAAGIFAASLTTNNLFFWLTACAGFGLLAGFFHVRSQNAFDNFSFLALFISLGALRYAAATDVAAGRSVENFAGLNRRMFISGRVCELPEIKGTRTRIYLDKVEVGWKKRMGLEGKILLSIGQPISSLGLGDRIEFTGFLDSLWHPANPGSLDFARYMRIHEVEGTVFLKDSKGISVAAKSSGGVRSGLTKARDFVEQKLTQGLPPKAAGVIKGFVLGDTRDIEPSTYELFRKTGTLHLLAVSGANVAWVALMPILLLKLFYISLRGRYLAALTLVWIFVLLTDLQASVLRAAIMFTVWAASRVIYREISGLQSLGLCALFLLAVNPLWFFDIGFELSFLAVFALIFSFAEEEKYEKNWAKRWLIRPFRNNSKSSAAVFLLITPLLAYYFNQVAWTSLLVNVAAMPLTALITWSALVRLGIGFSDFSSPLVFVQEKLFGALFWVQDLFVNLPHTLLRVPHPKGVETFLLTAAGFGLFLVLFKSQYRKAGLYFFLFGLTPVIWGWAFKRTADFSLSVLEARGEMVSVLSLPGQTLAIGGGRVDDKQHTPRQVLEPVLAYLGKDKIEGYLPLRSDSSARVASDEIAKKFRPDFIGRPIESLDGAGSPVPADLKFEYLLVSGDSVPFALRLLSGEFAFLFIPQLKKSRLPLLDSILAGPTVLVAPLEFARAESLAGRANVKAVVSTQRAYRLPQKLPDKVFFPFRDGTVTFQTKEEGLTAQTYLSKRKLVLTNP